MNKKELQQAVALIKEHADTPIIINGEEHFIYFAPKRLKDDLDRMYKKARSSRASSWFNVIFYLDWTLGGLVVSNT